MKLDARTSTYSNLLLIVVAAFLIHGSVLDRFWLADDPQVLLQAVRYEPLEIVTETAAWQELSTSNFTPLVTWSFDLDLALFGPEPLWFYIHQILSLAFVAIALRWLMLVLGLTPRLSLSVAILFLATPPVVHAAGLLMTRHYIEGLGAAVVAAILWFVAEKNKRHRPALIAASVAAYLIALLSKEVFLLLPLILMAISSKRATWKQVVRRLIPFAVVLLAYLWWRSWILGSTGGYGNGNVALHLLDVTYAWIRSQPLVAFWLITTIAICGMTWLRSRSDVLRVLMITGAVFAPLVGIGDALEGRHLLFPGVVAVVAATAGLGRRSAGRWRALGFVIMVPVTLLSSMFAMIHEKDSTRRMQAEGRYVWDASSEDMPLLAGSPAWYLDGLAELDSIWRNETSPEVFYSEIGALLMSESPDYVHYGDDGMPHISYLEDIAPLSTGYLTDAPIAVEITRNAHALEWSFGPQCECTWRFYSYPDYQGFVISREGARIVPRPREQQWFRIERRETSGNWTLSPPLPLPREGETIEWKRAN